MADVEAYFGVPPALQRRIRREGLCPEAFDVSGRVNVPPLLKAIFQLEQFSEADLPAERAKLIQEQRAQKSRENALANGQLVTKDGIMRELAGPLTAIRDGWTSYPLITGRKIKSLLQGAGVDPEIVRRVVDLAVDGVAEPLRHLRQMLEIDPANASKTPAVTPESSEPVQTPPTHSDATTGIV